MAIRSMNAPIVAFMRNSNATTTSAAERKLTAWMIPALSAANEPPNMIVPPIKPNVTHGPARELNSAGSHIRSGGVSSG